MLTRILSFFLALFSFLSLNPITDYDYSDKLGDKNYKGFKEYYADYFDIGAAVAGYHCVLPDTSAFLLKNFSTLTAENSFKQDTLNPADGKWNYADADIIANFCKTNGIKLRGHCLIWGNLGSWMTRDSSGNLVSKEVLLQRMHNYISTVVNRYKSVVRVWDVVNEPFGYDIQGGAFKANDFYTICGEEYITKAFEYAHEADPTAVLCLNETTVLSNQTKQNYFLKYLEKWIDAGVPIHAVGLQSHWNLFEINVTPRRLQKLIDKLDKIGVDIQITECDMNIDAYKDDVFDELPKYIELLQSRKLSQLFEVLRKNADKISSVTFWGVNDDRPQINSDGQVCYRWALLFDRNSMPKNAFYAVCDFS
ncbi:MAG TPA: 1,4-beta-xylanase [Ruminococcaceae bacterium]|nr:1,4-beta-xylanase [Oscillospiraceae bacterium]